MCAVQGSYSIYFFSSKGAITGQFRRDGIVVPATNGTLALGSITWCVVEEYASHWAQSRGA